MWCGDCYISDPTTHFHVHRLKPGENGQETDSPRDELSACWGRKRQPKNDFLLARDGDHLMIPFECDLCIFRKLRGRGPDQSSATDDLLSACIRRVNLDAFWSRATSTVRGNRDKIRLGLRLSELVGLSGSYNENLCLRGITADTRSRSRWSFIQGGRESTTRPTATQFDTIRKLRSAYSNQVRAAGQANGTVWSLGDEQGRCQRLSSDPCASFWFYRFVEGCKIRMGQDWRPNRGLSTSTMTKLLHRVDERIDSSSEDPEKNRWIVFHTVVVIGYCLSLRCTEIFLLDLNGLRNNNSWEEPKCKKDHVIIALLGKVKGEQNHRQHRLPCAPTTKSGIGVYRSLKRLVDHKATPFLRDGPAISDETGYVFDQRSMDDCMTEMLEEILEEDPEAIPIDLRERNKIRVAFQVYRTLRRSSDTRALEEDVHENGINAVNRWRKKEKAKGHCRNLSRDSGMKNVNDRRTPTKGH